MKTFAEGVTKSLSETSYLTERPPERANAKPRQEKRQSRRSMKGGIFDFGTEKSHPKVKSQKGKTAYYNGKRPFCLSLKPESAGSHILRGVSATRSQTPSSNYRGIITVIRLSVSLSNLEHIDMACHLVVYVFV